MSTSTSSSACYADWVESAIATLYQVVDSADRAKDWDLGTLALDAIVKLRGHVGPPPEETADES